PLSNAATDGAACVMTGSTNTSSLKRWSSVQAAPRTVEPEELVITVFVATCQLPVFDGIKAPVELTSSSTTTTFKPLKFPTRVSPTSRLQDLQAFLLSQWVIAKSPYATISPDEQFYTFRGRILRLDSRLDANYISDNDTIYIRFSSMGKICDPWAMSTSELRAELKARNAYEIKLQPEQLMLKLQEVVMRESRLQRLQRATKCEETEHVKTITKELVEFQTKILIGRSNAKADGMERPASLSKWPQPPCPNRTVFLSISELERMYQIVPRDVLDPALFVFDIERKWVFDKHNILQKQDFDYKYMCFDKDFLEMLTLKEEAGMVFWFRPAKSYDKMSTFFTSFDDPVTGKKYNPLMLKDAKWLTLCGVNEWEGKVRQDGRKRDTTKHPRFTKSIMRITTNIHSGSFDYLAVQEILYQSNPTLMFAPNRPDHTMVN
ncbi:TPA: hypothetical protein N0F65_009014, partial [Lagenidium giganteum]